MTLSVRARRARRGARRTLASASGLAIVLAASANAWAQEAPQSEPPAQPESEPSANEDRIIVIGNRAIVASLQDVEPEQTYDEDAVASYAVSTVGELLDEIRDENGDQEPVVLVNGQPVSDLGDIADFPVEAIARIEQLPRGAAQRVGGAAGQRAYNVVLRPSVESATATLSREFATEGDWANSKGEVILTYVEGQDRLNLTFRGADSDPLFESERDLVPRAETTPFSPIGNIVPASGIEVDPALSALVGRPVTVVALPVGVTNPTLAALVGGANQINPSERSAFRTLRGASRPYGITLAGNKTLAPWLGLSVNGRLNWTESQSFSGLPSARFLIPATNPFTPFSTPVSLAVSDRLRPLTSTSDSTDASLAATLNATFGTWRGALVGRYDRRSRDFVSQLTGPLAGGLGTVDAATNPFAGTLAARIPVIERTGRSDTSTTLLSGDVDGLLFDLWAGPVQGRAGLSVAWIDLDASDTSGSRTFRRHEFLAKGGITVPLTSTEAGVLSVLGDSELALDIGWLDLGRFGTLKRHSIALNWQPMPALRVVASEEREEQAIVPELLAAPEVVTPSVPYFDPLTGQTVDVTTIYGGAGGLEPEDLRTRMLSLTATPLPASRLQLNADYVVTDLDNEIGALPPPSSAVVAAFPDRFLRDSSGTLVQVDNRSVNFARRHTEQLRFGLSFTLPLTEAVVIPPDREAGTGRRRIPPLNLQINASHTYVLEDRSVIRPGLPEIDLLEGGAIGIGGGRQRHSTDLTVALTKGGTGVRANFRNRGVAFLVIGSAATPDLLTFGSLQTFELKAFADLGQLMPNERIAKGTRITISADNVFNDRQRVRNLAGATPQAYQPAYRDPIGRTIMIELRKVF
jgi:iron complex outermembrane recepter protein